MKGEIRVTVIATGFDQVAALHEGPFSRSLSPGVLPFPQRAPRAASVPAAGTSVPKPTPAPDPNLEIAEMEIPTFIRRQMD
jgi:hypothetical protein